MSENTISNIFKYSILSIFTCKLFFNFFMIQNTPSSTFTFTLTKDQSLGIVYDDKEIAYSGLLFAKGYGFVTNVIFDRPSFSKPKIHKTALRPKALIIFHFLALKIYFKCLGQDINLIKQVPEHYFKLYGLSICVLKNILLGISMFIFYTFSKLLMNKTWAYFSVLVYLTFPSVIFYVGDFNILDTLVMPLNVIFWGLLFIYLDSSSNNNYYSFVWLGVIFLILFLIKPHHLLLLFILNILWSIDIYITQKAKNNIYKLLIINSIVILGLTFIVISNYSDFHSIFISTQSGFNLFHGHNPVARGSWSPLIWEKYSIILNPLLDSNHNLATLNEKQESDFYQSLSIQWIIQNPMKEIELIIRKFLMYFLPYNFMNWKINIYNALVYVLSCISILHICYNFKKKNKLIVIFTIPFISILLINLIYFVEYRWRYYAEPFMVFLSVYLLWSVLKDYKIKKKYNFKSLFQSD